MLKRLADRQIYKSRIFDLHEVDLDFDGQVHTYEYLKSTDSVMALPLNEKMEILFVREYFAAIDKYLLSLPKGRMEKELSLEENIQKELAEEVKCTANRLIKLGELTMSPGYNTHKSVLFLALNLEAADLKGDEPEELEVVAIPWQEVSECIKKGEISDARCIAALKLAEDYFGQSKINLNQMKFHGNHGFFDFEKENGQEFLIDLTITANLAKSAFSDDLKDTIDYGAVYEVVKTAFYQENFDLIEALAAHIGKAVVEKFDIFSVAVEVSKPQVPIKGDLHSSSVCITTFK